MQAAVLSLAFCALQLWPAARGGPQHQRFDAQHHKWPARLFKVESFEWENCGPSSDPAVIKSLSVDPSPIDIPGKVTVSASVSTTVAVEAPVQADVTLEKRLGQMWIKIPCVDKLGSCFYDDVCAILESLIPPGVPCPEPLLSYGIPCHCPFKAGSYNLPSSEFFIPNIDLPSFLTNGDYKLKAVLKSGDQELACIQVSCSLQAQSWRF
uniref:Ganglioside GM2 activator n=1 Tax=Pogona vitticeps TaxID=103695 RepID=A0A6J0V245_9SAUR